MEFVHPASRPVVAERMRLMMTEGAIVPLIQEKFVRVDGTTVDVEVSAGPLTFQGEPAIQVVVRDVSERLRAEQQLREAESKYRRLIEQIPVVTYMEALDELGSTIYVSPQLEPMLGYSPEEWAAEPGIWVRVLYPEDRRRVLAERRRVQRSGERLDIEYRVIRRDGRPIWVRDESVLVRDASGRPLFQEKAAAFHANRLRLVKPCANGEARAGNPEKFVRQRDHRCEPGIVQTVPATG